MDSTQFCIGQPHRGPSHAPSRRFLMPGNHLAHTLREDGLCTVSSTTTDSTQFQQFTATLQHTLSADERVRALVGIGSLAQPERVDRWSTACGEHLSAHTYIFQYALNDLLSLITRHLPAQQSDLHDRFDPRRRFEQAYPDLSTQLEPILAFTPAAAALHLLNLAGNLLQARMPAFPAPAVAATRAYLQTITST